MKEGRGEEGGEAGLGEKSRLRPHTHIDTQSCARAPAHKHAETIPKATGSGPGCKVHSSTPVPDTEINTERVVHECAHANTHAHTCMHAHTHARMHKEDTLE